MADTVRTLDYFNNLSTGVFKDNTTGDIDEQDLRDFLVTALMITSAQSVTTTDVTAAIGTHYELDLSGLTATRNFLLPVAAVGDRIRVKLKAGDADYELIIKGAATVTINGGTAATEWSRLFIDNEVVEFRATSATNWDVVNDGRIPSYCKIDSSGGTNQSVTSDTWTVLNAALLTTALTDEHGLADVANGRINIRRSGAYMSECSVLTEDLTGKVRLSVKDESANTQHVSPNIYSTGGQGGAFTLGSSYIDISTDTYLYGRILHNAGSAIDVISAASAFLTVAELL